jgi:hypothetical protein
MDIQQLRIASMRSLIILAVGARNIANIKWGPRGSIPTLLSVTLLADAINEAGADPVRLLHNDSPKTTLERANGAWKPAIATLSSTAVAAESISSLASEFIRHVRPMERGHGTRKAAWAAWRVVLCWAAAREGLASILPMTEDVLFAFLWDALTMGASFHVLKSLVSAIQSRHNFFRLTPPIAPGGNFSRLMKALARFQGTPRKLLFPISRDAVVRMLRLPLPIHPACPGPSGGCTLCAQFMARWRDCLAAVISTIGCMRPDELSSLTICDWWPDHDTRHGYPQFAGGAALHSIKMKNDQERKGHQRRFGKALDPSLDAVAQLGAFLHQANLARHPRCTKMQNLSTFCTRCPPLFPLSTRDGRGFRHDRQPSPTQSSEMIVRGLSHVGFDPNWFSGVCARRGGLSTAIEGGVPEHILWMQSGHAQTVAARTYVALGSPTLLYSTWAAFKL